MPRALLAKVDFQAIGEEGEEVLEKYDRARRKLMLELG
jgi:hypothetical protein